MPIFWLEARHSTSRSAITPLSSKELDLMLAFGSKLITLPYNLLLQKSAREALGINLKDQIVLIDEAHSKNT